MSNVLVVTFAAVAAGFDIKTGRIPNKLVLGMSGAWLLLFAYEMLAGTGNAVLSLIDSALGLALGAGIFMTVYLMSRRGLGGGDVKFMGAAGLYLGLAGTLPAILYGTVLAALTGLILILLKKITRRDTLPLAPFLFAGILIAVLSMY